MFHRDICTACGKCIDACINNVLTYYGKEMSVEELLPILLEDREFYDNSGGGVTLSGGECLCQADFCAEILRALKAKGKGNCHGRGYVPLTYLLLPPLCRCTLLHFTKCIIERRNVLITYFFCNFTH